MRNIKFRAYSEKYKKLYGHGMYRVWEISIEEDGSLSGNVDETPIVGNTTGGYIPRVYFDKNRKGGGLITQDDDVFILMQYTGLHDNNGIEIYEKDILKKGKYIGLVYYDEAEGSYFIEPFDKKWDYLLLGTNVFDMEVIGNIYENQELLK